MTEAGRLTLPDYEGACIASIVPALDRPGRDAPWLPEPVRNARQIVLLVLDGLGWRQLQERRAIAPMLASMEGGPITSVVPSTTSTALTSITVGRPPSQHGVIGYRVHVGEGNVLNVLRWQIEKVDAVESTPPRSMQSYEAFGGRGVPVITKAEFERGGFTTALLGDNGIVGYRMPSTIAVEVKRALEGGEELVYAYYDGVDKIAHAHGFGDHYDAELRTADRLVADIASALPRGAALLVTADHGQVEVGSRIVDFGDDVLDGVDVISGEGRFRWLHARTGSLDAVVAACRRFEDEGLAWVRTREEAVDQCWFGGDLAEPARERMGDVIVAARAPVTFRDPSEGDVGLICRHGSLTADEMLVPLVAVGG